MVNEHKIHFDNSILFFFFFFSLQKKKTTLSKSSTHLLHRHRRPACPPFVGPATPKTRKPRLDHPLRCWPRLRVGGVDGESRIEVHWLLLLTSCLWRRREAKHTPGARGGVGGVLDERIVIGLPAIELLGATKASDIVVGW